MIGRLVPGPRPELEVFGTARACALVAGVLSLFAPFLNALTGTLAALAFAGWCSGVGRDERRRRDAARPGSLAALGIGAVGATVFVFPGPVSPARGLLLALALLPLWGFARFPGRISAARGGAP